MLKKVGVGGLEGGEREGKGVVVGLEDSGKLLVFW